MTEAERIQRHPSSYGGLHVVYNDRDPGRLVIGAFCSFADGAVVLLGGEHNPNWVTTFPFCDFEGFGGVQPGHPKPMGDVTIGNDVWVAREALILAGTTIGDGAVIGARAVVSGSVAPYSIMVGNPARRAGSRFPQPIVERLLKIRWWDWPRERIERAAKVLMSPDVATFCDAVEQGRI